MTNNVYEAPVAEVVVFVESDLLKLSPTDGEGEPQVVRW